MSTKLPEMQLDVSVAEWFSIDTHISSTRTADLFKAYDRDLGRGIGLWLLRTPFEEETPELKKSLERLRKFVTHGVKTPSLISSGTDAHGILFCCINALDGTPVAIPNLETVEAERRFVAVLKIMQHVHELGIVCGDICSSSFWLTRGGEVHLAAVMGAYENAQAPVPPAETLYYLSPEERSGERGDSTFIADVFALGVLGYYLFTGQYPTENNLLKTFSEEGWQKPSILAPHAPYWLDDVIARCLDPIPGRRYAKAGDILSAIQNTKEKKIQEQSSLTSRNETKFIQTKEQIDIAIQKAAAHGPTSHSPPIVATGIDSYIMITLLIFIVVGIGTTAVWKGPLTTQEKDPEEVVASLKVAADDRMKAAIEIVNNSGELQEKKEKFEELAQSDDPLAGNILLQAAESIRDGAERLLVEQSLLDRSKRMGQSRAADVIQEWLQGVSLGDLVPEYAAVFKVIDPTIPPEGRAESLKQVAEHNLKLALELAAAAVVDGATSETQKKISVVIEPMIKTTIPLENVSLVALLMSQKDIADKYLYAFIPAMKELSSEELMTVAEQAGSSNNELMKLIISFIIERKILTPLRAQYLKAIIEPDDLLVDPIPAFLFRTALGKLSSADMSVFSTWMDTSSEKALLALTLDTYGEEVQREAIEYLAGRAIHYRAADRYVRWIRQKHWDSRAELAPIAGIIAMGNDVSEEEIRKKLKVLSQYTTDKELLRIIFNSEQEKVLKVALEEFGNQVESSGLLLLLGNPTKEVRLAAIQALRNRNDVTSLQVIVSLYEAESDPEVKAAYKENLWVIQQRS